MMYIRYWFLFIFCMIYLKLFIVIILVFLVLYISWINFDLNVIVVRLLLDVFDICRKEGKNINFIVVIFNFNEMNKKINFYVVKYKIIIVLCNVWNFVIN